MRLKLTFNRVIEDYEQVKLPINTLRVRNHNANAIYDQY